MTSSTTVTLVVPLEGMVGLESPGVSQRQAGQRALTVGRGDMDLADAYRRSRHIGAELFDGRLEQRVERIAEPEGDGGCDHG